MNTSSNDTLGYRLKLVHRLVARELHAQAAQAGPDARRDDIDAAVQARVSAAVPEDDYDTLLRSLDAIARELGWDDSQPMPARPGRGHRHGGFGPRHGFGPHRGDGFGPHRGHGFGHHDRHSEHGRGCGHRHGHGEQRGFAQHPAVAEAFERGFSRGYEQAQRD
ncbi:hypothetical protein ACH0CG_06035 [Microbacterium sp. 179-I 1D1 NHS]|uniref:hypothetical protein n=1 Tax=Microbacterium sp. 179-I 1D1 NHS TaxID=3374298 RepID=UPI003879C3C7